MTDEQRGQGEEPGSLAASNDPVIARKIKEGRARALADLRAMENWARSGFNSEYGEELD